MRSCHTLPASRVGLAQTELISAVLALAIAMGVVLRSRKRRLHYLFVAFAANVAIWYLAQFLQSRLGGPVWGRAVALAAVLLPQAGIRFLRSFVVESPGRSTSRLYTSALALGVGLVIVVLSPYHAHPLARGAVSLYVVGLFAATVVELYEHGRLAPSRLERARARYLVGVGAATTLVFLSRTCCPTQA